MLMISLLLLLLLLDGGFALPTHALVAHKTIPFWSNRGEVRFQLGFLTFGMSAGHDSCDGWKADDLGSIGCWRLEGLFKTVDTALNPVRASWAS